MKVFTTGQVAKICKVAPRTVSKWFDSGRLKGYRIPGSQDRRIPREYLIKFLKEHGMPLGDLEDEAMAKVLIVAQDQILIENRNLSIKRALQTGLLASISTLTYYAAYAYIVWRTLHGEFSIGTLVFLSGSFSQLNGYLQQILIGFTQIAGQSFISTTCSASSRSSRPSSTPNTPGRSPCRSSRASCSKMSGFAIRAPRTGRCAI